MFVTSSIGSPCWLSSRKIFKHLTKSFKMSTHAYIHVSTSQRPSLWCRFKRCIIRALTPCLPRRWEVPCYPHLLPEANSEARTALWVHHVHQYYDDCAYQRKQMLKRMALPKKRPHPWKHTLPTLREGSMYRHKNTVSSPDLLPEWTAEEKVTCWLSNSHREQERRFLRDEILRRGTRSKSIWVLANYCTDTPTPRWILILKTNLQNATLLKRFSTTLLLLTFKHFSKKLFLTIS